MIRTLPAISLLVIICTSQSCIERRGRVGVTKDGTTGHTDGGLDDLGHETIPTFDTAGLDASRQTLDDRQAVDDSLRSFDQLDALDIIEELFDASAPGDVRDISEQLSPLDIGSEQLSPLDIGADSQDLLDAVSCDSNPCINWYKDPDGDGFGSGEPMCLCDDPGSGYSMLVGDCNESNTGINPGVAEACNFVDDDCDGQTDESGAVDCVDFYLDEDGDGFGVTSITDCLCKAPEGWAGEAMDCDDDNPLAYPGAAELCDLADNDCDSATDEEDALGCMPYYLDQDKDGYGLSDQLKCLCEKIGQYTATKGGDCADDEYDVHPIVVELCDGLDNDCDGETDEEEAVVSCGVVAHGNVVCDGGCFILECDPGYYDFNEAFADGCECQSEADEILTQTCADATFLGNLPDSGSATSPTGKIVPVEDSDWFKIKAVDGADPGGCDTFHLKVRFLKNPNEAYVFDVFQDGCAGADLLCVETTLFEDYTDFHLDTAQPGAPGGECLCKPDANHSLTPPVQPTACQKIAKQHTCVSTDLCLNGTCVSNCAPGCGTATCGFDKCGTSCGTCTAPLFCNGGSCAEECLSDVGCDTIGQTKCSGDGRGYHACGEVAVGCLKWGAAKPCTSMPPICESDKCVECQPNCAGKSCGSDGCGGNCGTCPGGTYCNSGKCENTCISDAKCLANPGYFTCAADQISVVKCKESLVGQSLSNSADDTDAASHQCTDNTATYYVRVYRKPGAQIACDEFQMEFSNGLSE